MTKRRRNELWSGRPIAHGALALFYYHLYCNLMVLTRELSLSPWNLVEVTSCKNVIPYNKFQLQDLEIEAPISSGVTAVQQ